MKAALSFLTIDCCTGGRGEDIEDTDDEVTVDVVGINLVIDDGSRLDRSINGRHRGEREGEMTAVQKKR